MNLQRKGGRDTFKINQQFTRASNPTGRIKHVYLFSQHVCVLRSDTLINIKYLAHGLPQLSRHIINIGKKDHYKQHRSNVQLDLQKLPGSKGAVKMNELLKRGEDLKYQFVRKKIALSSLCSVTTNTHRGEKTKFLSLPQQAHRILKNSMCLVLPLDRNFWRAGPQLPAISDSSIILSHLLLSLYHTLTCFCLLPLLMGSMESNSRTQETCNSPSLGQCRIRTFVVQDILNQVKKHLKH